MASTLFGDRFLGRREPAWHRLGEVFPDDEKVSASEAMARADILFGIDKYPQVVKLPDGTEMETGAYAVVREPTHDDPQSRILGTVGNAWTALQAKDLGKMLDPISDKLPVETAGALGHGEKIFITLNAGDSSIAGEDHKLYWLVTDNRDGTGALSIAFTPVRVVCQNTLVTGMQSSKVSVNLQHTKSIQADTQFYLDIFNQMARTQETVVEALNSLTTVKIDNRQITSIIESAYPNAPRPTRLKLSDGLRPDDVPAHVWSRIVKDRKDQADEYEKRQSRVDRIRDSARELLGKFNEEFPHFANTPYASYQAIVETEDYRRGWEGSGTEVFGQRADAKARAFNKALLYVR